MSDAEEKKELSEKSPVIVYSVEYNGAQIDITNGYFGSERLDIFIGIAKKAVRDFFFQMCSPSENEKLELERHLEEIAVQIGDVGYKYWGASADIKAKKICFIEEIKEYKLLNSLIHEFIHMISYYSEEEGTDDSALVSCGLRRTEVRVDEEGRERGLKINVGLNEAVTEYYSLIARKALYKTDKSIYSYFMGVLNVGILEKVLGQELIKNAYFYGDLNPLQESLKEITLNEKSWIRLNNAITQRIAYVTDIACVKDVMFTLHCEDYVDDLLETMIENKLFRENSDGKNSESEFTEAPYEIILKSFLNYIYSKEDAPSKRNPRYEYYVEKYIAFKALERRWKESGLPESCFGRWIDMHLSAFRILSFNQIIECMFLYYERRMFENRICAIGRELEKEHSDMVVLVLDTLVRQIIKYDNEVSARHYDRKLIDDVKEKADALRIKIQSGK